MENVDVEWVRVSTLNHEAQITLNFSKLDEAALLIHVTLVGHPLVVLVPVAVGAVEDAVVVVGPTQAIVLVLHLDFRLTEII